MIGMGEAYHSLLHLFFPHVCEGCGSDLLKKPDQVCLRCLASLPETGYSMHSSNPVEKIFWGRLPVSSAFALYYFTKGSLIQQLMHSFKYHGNKELGLFLGQQMALAMQATNRFSTVQGLIPLPLFSGKEKRRGFNQARILCEGMSRLLNLPVLDDLLIRTTDTESQTRKGRVERWENMDGRFRVKESRVLEGKHVLLVDDVITTGATLEACGRELMMVPRLRLSIATLCFSSGN